MSPMALVAIRSVAHRLPTFTATAVAVCGSALLMGTFAGVAESAFGDRVPAASGEVLLIMGMVIGAWGAVLALFALISTLSVAVRRRDAEIGTLAAVGATPSQARRLIQAEVVIVGGAATLVGVLLARPASSLLFDRIHDAGMIAPGVRFSGGLLSSGVVAATTMLVATIASRRAAAGLGSRTRAARRGGQALAWWRVLAAVTLVAAGLGAAAVTLLVTRHDSDPFMAMASSGNAGLLVAVGLAVLAAPILAGVGRLVTPLLARLGTPAELAGQTLRERGHALAAVLGAGTTFSAAATGVILMMEIDRRTFALAPDTTQAMADAITMLNTVVVAMIVGFSLLVLINALLAVLDDRRAELATLGRLGATASQIRQAVAVEAGATAAAAALLGASASLATVVPFSIARGEGPIPDGQLWVAPLVGSVLVAVTTLAAVLAATGALRRDARRRGGPGRLA